jgi:DNA-binding response OmpR family regulator
VFASQTPPLIVLAEFEEPGKVAGPLVQAGFRTETVDTGDAALRFCGITAVTLVISRVMFRYGMTGVELAGRLQSLAAPPRVILVTAFHNDKLRTIPGFPVPGVPVLRKPIMPAELLQAVTDTLAGVGQPAARAVSW